MDNIFIKIAVVALTLFLIWRLYTQVKANPSIMNKDSLLKSATSMGILALLLIGFVTLLVLATKS